MRPKKRKKKKEKDQAWKTHCPPWYFLLNTNEAQLLQVANSIRIPEKTYMCHGKKFAPVFNLFFLWKAHMHTRIVQRLQSGARPNQTSLATIYKNTQPFIHKSEECVCVFGGWRGGHMYRSPRLFQKQVN